MHRHLLILIFSFSVVKTAHSGKLVYMKEAGVEKQIILSSTDGKGAVALTSGKLWHLYPDIDSRGEHVAYVEGEDENSLVVVTVDMRSGAKVKLTDRGRFLHPDFSGDGKRVAYSAPVGGNNLPQIVIRDLTVASFPSKVIASEYASYFPALSSDATFVIFQRSKAPEKKDIVLRDMGSTELSVLSPAEGESMAPSLSFDDREVVYTSKVEGNWDLYITHLLTKKTLRLTDHQARDFAPVFKSDGGIIFASDRKGHFELYEISATEIAKKTFGVKRLVESEASLYAPSVSGDTEIIQAIMPSIPRPGRSSFGSIRSGDRIYITGGHQGSEHTYPPESFLDLVEYFDLKTGAWHRVAPRPVPSHGYGLAAGGKYIYAFGGFAYSKDHKPKWKSLDQIDRYDTFANRWETISKLPRRRSSNAVVTYDNKVYLIGGWDSTPKFENDYGGRFHSEIDVFDLKSETVSVSSSELPKPLRRAFTAVVKEEGITLVGGLGVGATHFELLDNVTFFSPKDGTWKTLTPLPFPTFAPAAGVLDGRLFVFGGMFKISPKDYIYVNHVYSWKEGEVFWSHSGRFLHESKGFSQVIEAKKGLAILGGHTYEGASDYPVASVEFFGKR